jgi:hypothetical protein
MVYMMFSFLEPELQVCSVQITSRIEAFQPRMYLFWRRETNLEGKSYRYSE